MISILCFLLVWAIKKIYLIPSNAIIFLWSIIFPTYILNIFTYLTRIFITHINIIFRCRYQGGMHRSRFVSITRAKNACNSRRFHQGQRENTLSQTRQHSRRLVFITYLDIMQIEEQKWELCLYIPCKWQIMKHSAGIEIILINFFLTIHFNNPLPVIDKEINTKLMFFNM